MSPDSGAKVLEGGEPAAEVRAGGSKTRNLFNKMEWAGAFGDIGTLIPFVVAYITIVKIEPLGSSLCLAFAHWLRDFITEHRSPFNP